MRTAGRGRRLLSQPSRRCQKWIGKSPSNVLRTLTLEYERCSFCQ
jgi:hypothetical protein